MKRLFLYKHNFSLFDCKWLALLINMVTWKGFANNGCEMSIELEKGVTVYLVVH